MVRGPVQTRRNLARLAATRARAGETPSNPSEILATGTGTPAGIYAAGAVVEEYHNAVSQRNDTFNVASTSAGASKRLAASVHASAIVAHDRVTDLLDRSIWHFEAALVDVKSKVQIAHDSASKVDRPPSGVRGMSASVAVAVPPLFEFNIEYHKFETALDACAPLISSLDVQAVMKHTMTELLSAARLYYESRVDWNPSSIDVDHVHRAMLDNRALIDNLVVAIRDCTAAVRSCNAYIESFCVHSTALQAYRTSKCALEIATANLRLKDAADNRINTMLDMFNTSFLTLPS